MSNIIERLYFAFSEENNLCADPDYGAAFKGMSALMDEIEALLPTEERRLTGELYSLMSKMMLTEAKAAFAGGFKTALELLSECAR